MRTRHRTFVLATCVLGALGAGVVGIASAQTTGHRPAGRTAPLLGPATQVADTTDGRRPPRPRSSVTRSAPPSTLPPTTEPSATPPPSSEPPATVAPTTVPPSSAPATTPPAEDSVIDRALAHINAARTSNGLTPYVLSPELTRAAEAHNALMAGGCGLSHQCPGEAGLGARFTAAGVAWNAAGENVGQGNAAATEASIVAAANGRTDLMLAETPPNDGHRRNLLNPGFTRIGLAVTRGSDGRVWLTQDFVN